MARACAAGKTARSASRRRRPRIDLATTIAWKDGIVEPPDRRRRGAAEARPSVKIVHGRARVPRRQDRGGRDRDRHAGRSAPSTIVIATGSEPVELPFLPFGGRVISSTEALSLDARARSDSSWSAAAISGWNSASPSPSSAPRSRSSRREDRILPLYDAELTAPVARSVSPALGVDGADSATRAQASTPTATGCWSRRRTAGSRASPPTRSSSPSAARRASQGFGLEQLDLDHGRPLRPHRRPAAGPRCATSARSAT